MSDYRIRHKYGITHEDRERMARAQKGKCAICKNPPPPGQVLHLDHSHRTGTIRALLCSNCNHLLGKAGESLKVLKAAIEYLRHHRE